MHVITCVLNFDKPASKKRPVESKRKPAAFVFSLFVLVRIGVLFLPPLAVESGEDLMTFIVSISRQKCLAKLTRVARLH